MFLHWTICLSYLTHSVQFMKFSPSWWSESRVKHTVCVAPQIQEWKPLFSVVSMNSLRSVEFVCMCVCFLSLVSLSWVGHSDTRGQRSDQQDADYKPCQTHHSSWGPQTPLDLCMSTYFLIHTHKFTVLQYLKGGIDF